MFRQKGSSLIVDDRNIAQSGIIIRHLVLPGFVGQSINILNYIAKEISPDLHVSLMSQYYPTEEVADHKDLGRTLTVDEFERVEAAFHEAGLYRGWIQEMGSHACFVPTFEKSNLLNSFICYVTWIRNSCLG
jgi:putative pyruvate formate lyase activating enzyme